jgi:DHA1 family inner membrane transport protein
MIMMPLGSFLLASWNISTNQFSLLISSFAIAGGLSSFAAVFYIQRYNRLKALFWIFLCFTLGLWLTSFAPNYEILLLARIFTGIFGGLVGPLILAEISVQFEYSNRSKPISITTIALALASIIGVPLGLYLAQMDTWRLPFILLSGLSSVVSFLLYFVHSPQKEVINKKKKINLKAFFIQRKPLLGLLLTITVSFSQFIIFIYLAPYFVQNLGVTEKQLSFIYLVGGVSILVFAPIIGFLSDKYGKQKTFILLSLLLTGPIYMVSHCSFLLFQQVLILSVFYFGLDAGRRIPVNTIISELANVEDRTAYLNLCSSIKKMAIGSAALIGGFVIQTLPNHQLLNFDQLGIIALGSITLSMFLVLRIKM